MKNILLITTIYPIPDTTKNRGTASIHYFTREWVKMGYNVKVVHIQTIYPIFYYLAAKVFRELIASRTGAVVYTKRDNKELHYSMDGVSVDFHPLFKKIPHGKYTKRNILNEVDKIVNNNKNNDFTPEIIIGHFANPQLEIISRLKKIYTTATTSLILHGEIYQINKIYKYSHLEYMANIDYWGFRSRKIKDEFENTFGKKTCSFMCYSGVPANYISNINKKVFNDKISNFIYIGELIERKNPVSLIRAVNSVFPNKDFVITYIGSGAEKRKLIKEIDRLKIQENIDIIGKIPRDSINQYLDEADCFIMISRHEAFGLVYLEAMARGCITIGSRNEGIDGIIQHGINGFLCEAGNDKELAQLIIKINLLTPVERRTISKNAISTASELTDFKAAEKYIKSLII